MPDSDRLDEDDMRFDPQSNYVPGGDADGDNSSGRSRGVLGLILTLVLVAGLGGSAFLVWQKLTPRESQAKPSVASIETFEPLLDVEALLQSRREAQTRQNEAEMTSSTKDDAESDATARSRRAYHQGSTYVSLGRHAEAIPHLQEAIALDPDLADAHYKLGLAYIRTGSMQKARQQLAELKKLDPNLANLLTNLIH